MKVKTGLKAKETNRGWGKREECGDRGETISKHNVYTCVDNLIN